MTIISTFSVSASIASASVPLETERSLTVRYTCKSDKLTVFANGDRKLTTQLTKEVDWVISGSENKNLVISNQAWIWLRQGYGEKMRSLNVFRYQPHLHRQDSQEVSMGLSGSTHSHVERFVFEDPVFGMVHVKCLIKLEP